MENCIQCQVPNTYNTQVAVLDGTPVAPNEKVHAANMHGAAAEALLAIRKKYFPKGELDDNGGTIPPPSAGLVASDAREEATDPVSFKLIFPAVCISCRVI